MGNEKQEARQEAVELRQDTKAELQKLMADIDSEQTKILDKELKPHNKKYDEKLERNRDVLIDKVDRFVDRVEHASPDVLSPTRKVAMLQEIFHILNDYIRGIDGVFSAKNRVADRLSGALDRFNKEITENVIVERHEAPRVVVVEKAPVRVEIVRDGIYTVKEGDSLSQIVKNKFGIDWQENPAQAFAVVRLLSDKCRVPDVENADPNDIKAGSQLDFGKARSMLGPDGKPTAEHMAGIIEWYNSIPSTVENGWEIGQKTEKTDGGTDGGATGGSSSATELARSVAGGEQTASGGEVAGEGDGANTNAQAAVDEQPEAEPEAQPAQQPAAQPEVPAATVPVVPEVVERTIDQIQVGEVVGNDEALKKDIISPVMAEDESVARYELNDVVKWGFAYGGGVVRLPDAPAEGATLKPEDIAKIPEGTYIESEGGKALGIIASNGGLAVEGFAWVNGAGEGWNIVKLPTVNADKSYNEKVSDFLIVGAQIDVKYAKNYGIVDEAGAIKQDGWGLTLDSNFVVKLPAVPAEGDKAYNPSEALKSLPDGVRIPLGYAEKLKAYKDEGDEVLIPGWGDNYDYRAIVKIGDDISKIPQNTYVRTDDAIRLKIESSNRAAGLVNGWGWRNESNVYKLPSSPTAIPNGITVSRLDPAVASLFDANGCLIADGWTPDGNSFVRKSKDVPVGLNVWVSRVVGTYLAAHRSGGQVWDKEEHPEGPFYTEEGSDVIEYAEDSGIDDNITEGLPSGVAKAKLVQYLNAQWNIVAQ